MRGNGYRDIIAWQKSMLLVEQVYRFTSKFPPSEQFGLTSQMRRCAVSIPSNIAEGSKRHSRPDFRHFLSIALGSAAELETQVEIATRLKMMQDKDAAEMGGAVAEVTRILTALFLKLK